VTGLGSAAVNFGTLNSLTILDPTGGNTFNVNGLPGATTINTGANVSPGSNTVNVGAVASPLNIVDQANDQLNLGSGGLVGNISGLITISGVPSTLVLDDHNDATPTRRSSSRPTAPAWRPSPAWPRCRSPTR
jgi:hypothetical protein